MARVLRSSGSGPPSGNPGGSGGRGGCAGDVPLSSEGEEDEKDEEEESAKPVKIGHIKRKLGINRKWRRDDGRIKTYRQLRAEGHPVSSPPSHKKAVASARHKKWYQARKSAGNLPPTTSTHLRCPHGKGLKRCRDCWENMEPGPRMRQSRLLSVGADGGGYTSLVYR